MAVFLVVLLVPFFLVPIAAATTAILVPIGVFTIHRAAVSAVSAVPVVMVMIAASGQPHQEGQKDRGDQGQ